MVTAIAYLSFSAPTNEEGRTPAGPGLLRQDGMKASCSHGSAEAGRLQLMGCFTVTLRLLAPSEPQVAYGDAKKPSNCQACDKCKRREGEHEKHISVHLRRTTGLRPIGYRLAMPEHRCEGDGSYPKQYAEEGGSEAKRASEHLDVLCGLACEPSRA